MEQTPDFSISLKGKTALVTGGGAGIGQRIATAYAALGAEVAVLEIDAERAAAVKGELDAIGHKNIVLRADVTDSNAVKSAMHEIDEKFGKLDILVNNVGDNLRLRG